MDVKNILMLVAGIISMIAGVIFMAIGYTQDVPAMAQAGWALVSFILGVVFGQVPAISRMAQVVKRIVWREKE